MEGESVMSLGNKIKELRIQKHLTQKELGDMLNVSGVTISNYERDSRVPPMEKFKKMASIFSVNTDYLMSFVPESGLTIKEQRDIGLEIDRVLEGLSSSTDINFYGEPLSEEGRQNLKIAIQTAMEINKKKAKQKYTPKKYK